MAGIDQCYNEYVNILYSRDQNITNWILKMPKSKDLHFNLLFINFIA